MQQIAAHPSLKPSMKEPPLVSYYLLHSVVAMNAAVASGWARPRQKEKPDITAKMHERLRTFLKTEQVNHAAGYQPMAERVKNEKESAE